MDPITLGLIGAGVGLAKSEFIDRPKEERQRKMAAEIMRWSPWTGMQPGQIKEADPFGAALSTGLTGASLGQQLNLQGGNTGAAKDVSEVVAMQPTQEQAYMMPASPLQRQSPMQMNPYFGMTKYGVA